jgi:hypothetical protein
MNILVRSIAGTSAWQYRVNKEDIPGTTEHPTNAAIPASSTSEDNSWHRKT